MFQHLLVSLSENTNWEPPGLFFFFQTTWKSVFDCYDCLHIIFLPWFSPLLWHKGAGPMGTPTHLKFIWALLYKKYCLAPRLRQTIPYIPVSDCTVKHKYHTRRQLEVEIIWDYTLLSFYMINNPSPPKWLYCSHSKPTFTPHYLVSSCLMAVVSTAKVSLTYFTFDLLQRRSHSCGCLLVTHCWYQGTIPGQPELGVMGKGKTNGLQGTEAIMFVFFMAWSSQLKVQELTGGKRGESENRKRATGWGEG